MLEEYNFENARKNPYAKKLKRQITINIDSDTVDYFKDLAIIKARRENIKEHTILPSKSRKPRVSGIFCTL
jgi:hypothetical protein